MHMPGMTFRPTVTVATPGQELRWVGTLGIKQLFHGQHSFVLSPNHDGTTRLTNHEEFSGALVTLIRPFLRTPKKTGTPRSTPASSSGWKTAPSSGRVREGPVAGVVAGIGKAAAMPCPSSHTADLCGETGPPR